MKEFIEKMIERLEEKKNEISETNEGTWFKIGFDVAYEIAKQLAEEYKSNVSENLTGWIPCSVRLPEDGSKVIITTKAGNVMAGIYTKHYGFRQNEGFTCDVCFIYLESVIAWMPLPEQYKPKEIPANHYIERFNRVN